MPAIGVKHIPLAAAPPRGRQWGQRQLAAHLSMRVPSKQLVFLLAFLVALFILFGPFAPELGEDDPPSSSPPSSQASGAQESVREIPDGVSGSGGAGLEPQERP